MSTESEKRDLSHIVTSAQLEQLIAVPGLKLPRLTQLLGAEGYLSIAHTAKGDVQRFDVKAFLQNLDHDHRKLLLPDEMYVIDDVILEPGEGEFQTGEGNGIESSATIQRTQHVMELLGTLDQPYVMIDGKNRQDMVRQLSYTIFILKKARKLLFVNDEADNATFVVHHFKHNVEWKEYRKRKKEELRTIAKSAPHLISVLEFRYGMDEFIESLRELIEREYIEQDPISHTPESIDMNSEQESHASWITDAEISQRTGVRVEGVRRWIEKLRLPEDAPDQVTADGTVQHWSSLADRVSALLERPVAPDGWWNILQVANTFGRSRQYVEKILTPIIQEQSEWMDWYYTRSEKGKGVLTEHYSQQALDVVQEVLAATEYAPERWQTAKWLMRKYGGNRSKYVRVADRYRLEHPEWFHTYLTSGGKKGGKAHEHYAPELIERILAELKNES